tara:strand:+ start:10058 stop:10726 length:669 start_codon:yes stop_codon:yes gene_type:complete
MLIPIKRGELERLIPAVATATQFRSALGTPRKILQRVMISSIGGVLTFLVAQSQFATRFYALWILVCVTFLIYILWGPILEASKENSKIRRFPFIAIFRGNIFNIKITEKIEKTYEQANNQGKLEYIEDRRAWMCLDLVDNDGYLTKVSFPLENKHQVIREGMQLYCLVFSYTKNFSEINGVSDLLIPKLNLWLGKYPYLLRPAFTDLCRIKFGKISKSDNY